LKKILQHQILRVLTHTELHTTTLTTSFIEVHYKDSRRISFDFLLTEDENLNNRPFKSNIKREVQRQIITTLRDRQKSFKSESKLNYNEEFIIVFESTLIIPIAIVSYRINYYEMIDLKTL